MTAEERKNEYWVLLENGSEPEWGLLQHCVRLAKGYTETAALLHDAALAARAFAYGAARVYVLDRSRDERRTGFQIAGMAKRDHPEAILCTAHGPGRMIAATAAAVLGTGLAADCVSLRRREDGLLVMTRPAFGGDLMADIICPEHRPQMATVRSGIYFPNSPGTPAGEGEIIREEPDLLPGKVELLHKEPGEKRSLMMAEMIVAGGKGIGSRDGFALLERLADALGASLGASRAAVNAGYAPYSRQIGLTGRTVRPKVYLAMGISGAVQHIVGMERSGTIIAVNTDRKAPIFDYADYGIIADWRETAEEMLRFLSR